MGKLFGTDGIRGVANSYPITADMAVKVGRAVARFCQKPDKENTIVIGKDTRLSGDMIMAAMAAGICSMGVNALIADTLPTPGVAFLTRQCRAMAGIMISASHNPFEDNGIKVFNADGFKPSVADEDQIEALVTENECECLSNSIKDTGIINYITDAVDEYKAFLIQTMPEGFSLAGARIVLDCANGATAVVAPDLFKSLGADTTVLFDTPDGKNINDNCGSQHPDHLAQKVLETHADFGLAFDGDGDRLIAVDEKGNTLTGDQIMFICARAMKHQGVLDNDLVVSTVMSNIGFKNALAESGISTLATDVGDRYVMEKMKETKAVLGGEDSGHTIFLSHHTTGDGILTALKLIESARYSQAPLSELAGCMPVFPQVLINVSVKAKPDLSTIPKVCGAISGAEKQLGEKGRVLVRYSGTQAMCRVMVEGPTEAETRQHAETIANVIDAELG